MAGRRAPEGRDAAAAALGDYLPAIGRRDAALFVDRLAGLVDGGEHPGSLLARLNGPARRPDPSAIDAIEEPPPSRSTLAALGATIRPAAANAGTARPAGYPRNEDVNGIACRIDLCADCDQPFATPRRRGRYPQRCHTCSPRSDA